MFYAQLTQLRAYSTHRLSDGATTNMTLLRIKEGDPNYTLMLLVAGFVQIWSGLTDIASGWVICWCGVGFILVALAYIRIDESIFGKRPDGDRAWSSRIVLFPFLVLNVILWHLRHRILSKEDTCNEIAPGIWLGRRPIDGELPPDVTLVVDLTAEFSATPDARKLNYLCVPTLDGCAPRFNAFSELMNRLTSSNENMYIHCAAGHGRSAMVAAAMLIARGLASDVDGAEAILIEKRPRVSIKKPQREMLQHWLSANRLGD